MHCPTLRELPPPYQEKTGWPWTKESSQLPDTMHDGSPWPKISIITPSFNQDKYIEETIRSVLLQGYPNLEYIIIDGGSKDGSVDIIKKYDKWLTYWVSETDEGQTNAINKGFKKSTGDILAWINSDDYYLANAFNQVIEFININPSIDLFYGDLFLLDEIGGASEILKGRPFSIADQVRYKYIAQQTCFWRHDLFNKVGYLNETYENIFDVDFIIRASLKANLKYLPYLLACYRIQPEAKTQKTIITTMEGIQMYEKLFSQYSLPEDVLKLKGEIFEHWYERLAIYYFKNRSYELARKWFIKAFYSSPWRYQNVYLILYVIDTYLYTSLSKNIRRIRLKLR
jgi:glycosyltransferase involved in cell wall biosynthesis